MPRQGLAKAAWENASASDAANLDELRARRDARFAILQNEKTKQQNFENALNTAKLNQQQQQFDTTIGTQVSEAAKNRTQEQNLFANKATLESGLQSAKLASESTNLDKTLQQKTDEGALDRVLKSQEVFNQGLVARAQNSHLLGAAREANAKAANEEILAQAQQNVLDTNTNPNNAITALKGKSNIHIFPGRPIEGFDEKGRPTKTMSPPVMVDANSNTYTELTNTATKSTKGALTQTPTPTPTISDTRLSISTDTLNKVPAAPNQGLSSVKPGTQVTQNSTGTVYNPSQAELDASWNAYKGSDKASAAAEQYKRITGKYPEGYLVK
jgi:hypothetical protein